MQSEETVLIKRGAVPRALAAAIVLALALSGNALAQQGDRPRQSDSPPQSDSLMVDVGECVGIDSAEQRFACYEQRVGAALMARFSTGSPATPQGAPAADRGATGRSAVPASRAAQEAAREAASELEIVATVASVRQIVPNRLQITLDNGQVWRQTATSPFPLRPGHEVRIYQAGLGGYRLAVEELGGFIRVEQLQ